MAASPDGDPLIAMDLPAMGFRLLKSAAGWAWVVAVAGVVLGWRVAPGVQYLVISGVSLAATGLLCELGVRRHPVARFLFGLKPIRGTIDP